MALKSLVPWKREDRQLASRPDVDFPFGNLSRQIDRMFDDVLGDWPAFTGSRMLNRFFDRGEFWPQVEITETEKQVKVVADLPGLAEKDIEVNVENDVLVLRGEKRDEHKEERKGSYVFERRFGSFERMINLPEGIDFDS